MRLLIARVGLKVITVYNRVNLSTGVALQHSALLDTSDPLEA